MKILYFTQIQINVNKNLGIYKKLLFQIEALESLGNKVDFISDFLDEKNELRILKKDNKEEVLECFSKKTVKFLRYISYNRVYELIVKEKYDCIYIRYAQTAMPFFNNFLKKISKNTNTKVILEIPTYPYDGENKIIFSLNRFKIFLEKKYRLKLKKYIDKIVTFSQDREIWGIECINISNGINLKEIKMKTEKKQEENIIEFIHVSGTRIWHGIDRFLKSLLEYKEEDGNKKIKLHIVGEGDATPELKNMVQKNLILQEMVIFHGFKIGKELDSIYDRANIAIGSLGIHRIGLTNVQPLKNREYCAKGLPFIIGFQDIEFDEKEYVYKVSSDEETFSVSEIIKWYENLKISPKKIREDAEKFTWDIQMKKVVDNI